MRSLLRYILGGQNYVLLPILIIIIKAKKCYLEINVNERLINK